MTRATTTSRLIAVRPAKPGDAHVMAPLVEAFLRHEGWPDTSHVTSKSIATWLGGPHPAFEAFLVLAEGRARGYLAYYHAFSLFRGEPVFLVENLFVEEDARGLGLGRRLMAAAAAEARRRGLGRMEFNVRNRKNGTIHFYKSLGARAAGESVYRIEGPQIAALADSAS